MIRSLRVYATSGMKLSMSGSDRAEVGKTASSYSIKIAVLLDRPDIPSLMREYLDPRGAYAATSFDDLPENIPGEFRPQDFLALGFLDTPMKAATHRQFVDRRRELEGLLAEIDTARPLWEIDDATHAAASSLWFALLELDGIGVTRASKLMARKRPRLIPILDCRVREFFDHETEEFWWPLAIALAEGELWRRLVDLRSEVGATALSELRILDIAVWMGERNPPGTASSADE